MEILQYAVVPKTVNDVNIVEHKMVYGNEPVITTGALSHDESGNKIRLDKLHVNHHQPVSATRAFQVPTDVPRGGYPDRCDAHVALRKLGKQFAVMEEQMMRS